MSFLIFSQNISKETDKNNNSFSTSRLLNNTQTWNLRLYHKIQPKMVGCDNFALKTAHFLPFVSYLKNVGITVLFAVTTCENFGEYACSPCNA